MKIPAWLQENMGIRIMSLILAVFLWSYVTGGGETERSFVARVETTHLPDGLLVSGTPVERVELRLAGPRLLLTKISAAGQLTIPLNLTGVQEGVVTFAALDTKLPLPAGVRVTRIYPSTVELHLVRNDGMMTPSARGER
ncbi:CdaR family protein [Geomobilimonas luticola]|uniref:YbbR-like protein n=1 Tax=Geomobilimonas luticola TaxID=1114878 RepID=A0ABS5SGC3_9BACT|nr:hypothetical protein [Geomobilimonas luticola]MBT0654414.1 hypothetical protein [Geomobilimonas luticola]